MKESPGADKGAWAFVVLIAIRERFTIKNAVFLL
jgi:hypothetical protein